ncbi:MAG: hypothetical protein JO014_08250 [Metakosakonia sp.]|nr:hypothetical protein [Phytobacter sp.]MBV8872707.1 hypothetical protein [Phytobacter sp.]
MSEMIPAIPLAQQVTQNSIQSGPLPADQNITFLKQEGIRYLKAMAGQTWSNYNDSDPGVTILEQLCYALTELGYVNSFPIEDVLTGPDHRIAWAQQFFAAEEILTTGPITIEDYQRLVLDNVPEVDNVYLTPLLRGQAPTGWYQVAVDVADKALPVQDDAVNRLLARIDRLLNGQRNLGEGFLAPTLLKAQVINVTATLFMAPDADAQQVYAQINQALAGYVAPLAPRCGYGELRAQGLDASAIFNGPAMHNGWIQEGTVAAQKRSVIRLMDIVVCISGVEGVQGVAGCRFSDTENDDADSIPLQEGCVARLRFTPSSTQTDGATAGASAQHAALNALAQLQARHQNSSIDAKIDVAPPLPGGRYRNIAAYYSVQNTFPNIYAIGPNSLQTDTPDYRVAQARQLKGYLMLFDQVMANQFAQLANLGNLFSFGFTRTPVTGPEDVGSLLTRPDPLRGIPDQPAIQTLFCQPLYNVPDVQALLLGGERFQYIAPDDPSDARLQTQLAWQRFQRDPFNAYHYGLVQAMESTENAEQRRDEMLSHLLARHGEPADVYNAIIDALQWSGGKLKTRIVVKSTWLLNLQALSSRRAQAGDSWRATPVTPPGRYHLSQEAYRQWKMACPPPMVPLIDALYLKSFDSPQAITAACARTTLPARGNDDVPLTLQAILQWRLRLKEAIVREDGNVRIIERVLNEDGVCQRDGQWDLARLERQSHLPEQAFADFSTFELKCAILLGLPAHLRLLAATLGRLLQEPLFVEWLSAGSTSPLRQPERDDPITGDVSLEKNAAGLSVSIGSRCVLQLPDTPSLTVSGLQQYVDQLAWLGGVRQGMVLVEQGLLQTHPSAMPPDDAAPMSGLSATLVLPDYVMLTRDPAFLQSLDMLRQLHWPGHIALDIRQCNLGQMTMLINAWCQWYNLRLPDVTQLPPAFAPQATTVLLNALHTGDNGRSDDGA